MPYSSGATVTKSTALNGQVVTAQSANIAQGTASGSGFAGGDGSVNDKFEVEQNATAPSISYTITNSGAVAANSFYLSGSASGYTIGGNCGTSGSPVTLAANTGSCTATFTLNSTASTGSQNLNVSGVTMHWVDQDSPGGQSQSMSGTQYVNVYTPASIAITTSPASSISVAPGDSFTITAMLSGGYNVTAQTINAVTANSNVTFTNNDCALNSQNGYSCTIIANVSGTASTSASNTVTISNTTTPSMSLTPSSVNFSIGEAIVRIYLPQTGQLYCVAGTTFSSPCTSPAITSPDGSDGYGRSIPSYGDYIPYGVAWAYNGVASVNPSPRFTKSSDDCEVTDNLTGLIWLEDPSVASASTQNWATALTTANNGTWCGQTAGTWRLPNVNELASLVDQGASDSSAWLNTQGFNHVQAVYYWSSTTYADSTDYAWDVVMSDGNVYADVKTSDNHYVWPVRGGQ